MKISVIKSIVFALVFAMTSLIPASTQCAVRTTHSNPLQEVHEVLEECLFLKKNTRTINKPFSYFVNQLIEIVTKYQTHFKSYGTNLVETFKRDMQSIRNEKNGLKVGKVLIRYKQFMPNSFKAIKPMQLLSILKKRLAIQDDGSVDETIEQSTTMMERILGFLAACKERLSL